MAEKSSIQINDAFDLVQILGFERDKGKELLELCRQNDIASLGVFGSFSRGEQTGESDLDLLVTFSKGKSLIDHIKIEENLESLLGKHLDLVTERSLSPYLAPMIKKDLRRILCE